MDERYILFDSLEEKPTKPMAMAVARVMHRVRGLKGAWGERGM